MNKKHILGFFILVFAASLFFYFKFQEELSIANLEIFFTELGIWGPIVFMMAEAIAIIFSQIPNIPLTMVAGMIWGPYLGAFYALIGALIGGIIAFYIARLLGKDFVKKFAGDKYDFIANIPEKKLAFSIFIFRMLPILSFDIISYAAGLTNIKFRHFLIATFFGMIPMTFMFAYMGKSIMVGSWVAWVLTALILVLILLLPWILKQFKGKAL